MLAGELFARRCSARKGVQRGASAVEFALISLPLMTIMLGMLQYGWYFFSAQSASSAARESARRLVVGDCQAAGAAQSFAQNQANLSSLTLSFGSPGGSATTLASGTEGTLPVVGNTLRVIVNVDGSVLNFLPIPNNGQVQKVVDARVEDQTPGTSPCP